MTSNIGSHLIMDAFENVKEENIESAAEKAKVELMQLLRQTIRPEFLNRVDEVIMFQPLLKKEIQGIVRIQLNGLKKVLADAGINLQFSDYALKFLSEQGFDPQFGARPLKRLIQKEIINPLSKKILAGEVRKELPVVVDVFDGIVVFRNETKLLQSVK
jgi:ATP-dependent Clp protease ATP-binding subunit ClpB